MTASPDAAGLTRYRIRFAKTEAMRYSGHLDLMRALERTLRRAGLPLAYSQGFSPHPRLHLAAALPLGFTSRSELADVWLETQIAPEAVLAGLAEAAPPGLVFLAVEVIPLRQPVLQQETSAAQYELRIERPPGDLGDRLAVLLDADQIMRVRRDRPYDLRPLIEEAHLDIQGDEAVVHLLLSARPGATGRPEEVLEALGIEPAEADVIRTGLLLEASPASG
jgi:radical SAM-linked protein